MNPIYQTVELSDGTVQTIDLRLVEKVEGGTLIRGGPLPRTTITMANGTVHECTFLMLGPVVSVMKAHGLA